MIVDKFGGNIDFMSNYGKGTTFYFTFETVPLDSRERLAKFTLAKARSDVIPKLDTMHIIPTFSSNKSMNYEV